MFCFIFPQPCPSTFNTHFSILQSSDSPETSDVVSSPSPPSPLYHLVINTLKVSPGFVYNWLLRQLMMPDHTHTNTIEVPLLSFSYYMCDLFSISCWQTCMACTHVHHLSNAAVFTSIQLQSLHLLVWGEYSKQVGYIRAAHCSLGGGLTGKLRINCLLWLNTARSVHLTFTGSIKLHTSMCKGLSSLPSSCLEK